MGLERDFVLQVTYYEKNYGSALQAYALQRFLNEYGIECILVSECLSPYERLYHGLKRRFLVYKNEFIYKEFRTEKRLQIDANNLSKKSLDSISASDIQRFTTDELNIKKLTYKEMKCLSRKIKCRFCLAGSDQIWNGARVYFNPIYFLLFAPKEKRIAFAPSFGTNKIKTYNIRRYKNAIKTFAKISVREKSGLDIVKSLTRKDATVLLDPIFLLNRSDWQQLANKSKKINIENKYVFALFLNLPSTKAINALYHLYAEGLYIVTIGYAKNLSQLNVPLLEINGGPKEFLNLIARSSLICTDSFHVTAFSTIFNKQFFVFERNYVSTKQSVRIIDFLSDIGLIEQYEPEKIEIKDFNAGRFTRITQMMVENRNLAVKYLDLTKYN